MRRLGIGIGMAVIIVVGGWGGERQAPPPRPLGVAQVVGHIRPMLQGKMLGGGCPPICRPLPGQAVLQGTYRAGELLASVWISAGITGHRFPFALMADSGASHTMISGHLAQALHLLTTGQMESYQGIGGVETVPFYVGMWVWPSPTATDAILPGTPEPAGIGRLDLAQQGVALLLGQSFFTQPGVTLLERGGQWWLFYWPHRPYKGYRSPLP